jgi:hypothetical protein
MHLDSRATRHAQVVIADLARKKSPGDSRLNDWLYRILIDHHLSARVAPVAIVIRDNFDFEYGFSTNSFRSIASTLGIGRGTAESCVRALIKAGYLCMTAGGGGAGNCNAYTIIHSNT